MLSIHIKIAYVWWSFSMVYIVGSLSETAPTLGDLLSFFTGEDWRLHTTLRVSSGYSRFQQWKYFPHIFNLWINSNATNDSQGLWSFSKAHGYCFDHAWGIWAFLSEVLFIILQNHNPIAVCLLYSITVVFHYFIAISSFSILYLTQKFFHLARQFIILYQLLTYKL